MGLFDKIFGTDNRIKVQFIDDSNGQTIVLSQMEADQLPETFSVPTTMHIQDSDWNVEEASPENAIDFVKTKSLVLKMKRKYFFTLFIILLITLCELDSYGQIRDDLNITNIISDNIRDTYKKPKSQKVILFSLYLYINKSGILDSIGHSPLAGEPTLDKFLNKKKLTEQFSKSNTIFLQSKNSVIIMPYMVWYLDDISAKYMGELLEDFMNLFPPPEYIRGRKTVLNKPHYLAFDKPEIN